METITIRTIQSAADYEAALARVSELAAQNPPSGSSEAAEITATLALIKGYEQRQGYTETIEEWKKSITALDMIKDRMEEAGLTRKDMEAYLGSPGKVSEILSGRRRLSLTMIKKLHKGLGIPAEILIQ